MRIGSLNIQTNTGIYLVWVLILISLISLIWSKGGILDYRDLIKQDRELKASIEKIRYDRELLSEQLNLIKKNKSYLENIAREKIGMIKKNEIVYEIEYR